MPPNYVIQKQEFFKQTLEGIKCILQKSKISAPSCFISYAWEKDKEELQGTLAMLKDDLQILDIPTFFDIQDMHGNMRNCMEQILKADYVFLIGTPQFKTRIEQDRLYKMSKDTFKAYKSTKEQFGNYIQNIGIVLVENTTKTTRKLYFVEKGKVLYQLTKETSEKVLSQIDFDKIEWKEAVQGGTIQIAEINVEANKIIDDAKKSVDATLMLEDGKTFKETFGTSITNVAFEFGLTLEKGKSNPSSLVPLLYKGEHNTSFPLPILANALIRSMSMKEQKDYYHLLVGLSNPLGIIPAIYSTLKDNKRYKELVENFKLKVKELDESEVAILKVETETLPVEDQPLASLVTEHKPLLEQLILSADDEELENNFNAVMQAMLDQEPIVLQFMTKFQKTLDGLKKLINREEQTFLSQQGSLRTKTSELEKTAQSIYGNLYQEKVLALEKQKEAEIKLAELQNKLATSKENKEVADDLQSELDIVKLELQEGQEEVALYELKIKYLEEKENNEVFIKSLASFKQLQDKIMEQQKNLEDYQKRLKSAKEHFDRLNSLYNVKLEKLQQEHKINKESYLQSLRKLNDDLAAQCNKLQAKLSETIDWDGVHIVTYPEDDQKDLGYYDIKLEKTLTCPVLGIPLYEPVFLSTGEIISSQAAEKLYKLEKRCYGWLVNKEVKSIATHRELREKVRSQLDQKLSEARKTDAECVNKTASELFELGKQAILKSKENRSIERAMQYFRSCLKQAYHTIDRKLTTEEQTKLNSSKEVYFIKQDQQFYICGLSASGELKEVLVETNEKLTQPSKQVSTLEKLSTENLQKQLTNASQLSYNEKKRLERKLQASQYTENLAKKLVEKSQNQFSILEQQHVQLATEHENTNKSLLFHQQELQQHKEQLEYDEEQKTFFKLLDEKNRFKPGIRQYFNEQELSQVEKIVAFYGYINFVEQITKFLQNPLEEKGYTVVHYAAQYGLVGALRTMHSLGVNLLINDQFLNGSKGETPLHIAAKYGQASVVVFYVSQGLELEPRTKLFSFTPMLYAICYAQVNVLKIFHDLNLQFNYNKFFTGNNVHNKIEGSEDEIISCFNYVKTLGVNFGAIPNEKLIITYRERPKVVEYLLSQGVSIHSRFSVGQAIHYAARHGELDILIYLHQRGAMLNARGQFGSTPAYYAADGGYNAILRYLHDQGTDLKSTNDKGLSLSHAAAKSGHVHTLELLDELGLLSSHMDHDGKHPWDLVQDDSVKAFFIKKEVIRETQFKDWEQEYSVQKELNQLSEKLKDPTDNNIQLVLEKLRHMATSTPGMLAVLVAWSNESGFLYILFSKKKYQIIDELIIQTLYDIEVVPAKAIQEQFTQLAIKAVKEDDLILIRKLYDCGVDLVQCDHLNDIPATIAAKENKPRFLLFLGEKHCFGQKQAELIKIGTEKAKNKDFSILETLRKTNIDLSSDPAPVELGVEAAKQDDFSLLEKLHKVGVDLSKKAKGYPPYAIQAAYNKKNLDLFKKLVQLGANSQEIDWESDVSHLITIQDETWLTTLAEAGVTMLNAKLLSEVNKQETVKKLYVRLGLLDENNQQKLLALPKPKKCLT